MKIASLNVRPQFSAEGVVPNDDSEPFRNAIAKPVLKAFFPVLF